MSVNHDLKVLVKEAPDCWAARSRRLKERAEAQQEVRVLGDTRTQAKDQIKDQDQIKDRMSK